MKKLLLLILLLLPTPALAQDVGLFFRADCDSITSPTTGATACFQTANDGTRDIGLYIYQSGWQEIAAIDASIIPRVTVATLPSSPTAGMVRQVTDGTTQRDCTTGGGSSVALCSYNGSAWVPIGGGFDEAGNFTLTGSWNFTSATVTGITLIHDDLDELGDDDHSVIYVKYESSAGAPAAGSCDRAGQIQFDTTNSKLYGCYSAGGNPVDIATQDDDYNQICGDSGCTTASGSDTLTIATGAGLTSAGTSDTITITVDNHTKSIYFPANALTVDGTQCAEPALNTINSGPRLWTIICTDNDASTIYAHVVMPDSWNAGTFTVELEYVQTAADTGVLNSDVAGQCRGAGETINNTWGTEVALDDAAVSGSNIVDHTTTGAITADGTCAAGDTLFIRWQLDATGTTTAVATLHILGMKVEYTVSGAGSD